MERRAGRDGSWPDISRADARIGKAADWAGTEFEGEAVAEALDADSEVLGLGGCVATADIEAEGERDPGAGLAGEPHDAIIDTTKIAVVTR